MTFNLAFGSYIGNGTTPRAFTGLGFQPKFLLIKSADTSSTNGAVGKMNRNATDEASQGYGENAGVEASMILSLDADGFSLGSKTATNISNGSYYWAAFGGDTTEIVVGSYIGNATDNRDIGSPLGFKPAWVIIKGNNNDFATQKQGTTGDATDTAMSFSVFANAANEIQALANGSFQIGTSAKSNATNGSYYYIAIAPGSHIFTGSYVGDGANVRAITEIGWKPNFISTKIDTSANGAAWTNGSALGSNTLAYRAGAWFAGGFKSLDPTGFTLGSDARVNVSGGSYHYVALRTVPSVTITGSNSILSNTTIMATLSNTILTTSDIKISNAISANAAIMVLGSNSASSQSFIASLCQVYLNEKKNSETLQGIEVRDGHSIALKNVLSLFNNNIGSTIQTDYQRDAFATDNAFKAKHMIHVTGGSYQCINAGSTFYVMITCGSLTPSDFNINGCKCYKYAQGSYLLYGPDGPSLGSSRARVMKTLFYGSAVEPSLAGDARAGSEYIYQLGSIFVSTNSFGDVGRRAYRMFVHGSQSIGASDTNQYDGDALGSFEANSGSVWSWSYVKGLSITGAGIDIVASWSNPFGTVLNTATNTSSDETGLDMVADVKINPGSASLQVSITANSGVTEAGIGSAAAFFLTSGSFTGFTYSLLELNGQGSSVKDFMGSGVPKFGSITNTDLLDYTNTWVQFNPINGINGSVDTAIVKTLGSLSSGTARHLWVSSNEGSNFSYVCEGILGSIGPTTGSMIVKYELFKTGSTERDYVNGYGVYYG